jgi:hypothetical protein
VLEIAAVYSVEIPVHYRAHAVSSRRRLYYLCVSA